MKTAILVMLFLPTIVLAEIIHVPEDQPTIGDALIIAGSGDTIEISPRIYYEHGLTLMPKDLAIVGYGVGMTP